MNPQKIHVGQAQQTDRFWAELSNHLAELPIRQINNGMNLLQQKIMNSQAFTKERRQDLLNRVQQIQNLEISRQERPGKIIKLLKDSVPRHSLPEVLQVLGCQDSFLKAYVPQRSQKRFFSRR